MDLHMKYRIEIFEPILANCSKKSACFLFKMYFSLKWKTNSKPPDKGGKSGEELEMREGSSMLGIS